MRHHSRKLFGAFVLLGAFPVFSQNVIINEIMYHPLSESPLEEYIELWNRGATNVNLTGWRLSGGVDFAFPSNTTIVANGYLVVAAHLPTFQAKYPGVANVVGSWAQVGTRFVFDYILTNYLNVLSNTRNPVNLRDAADQLVNNVTYADEGDWAVRQRGPDDVGRRGWIWFKEHDGLGKSLELINPDLPNENGQNWAASSAPGGTPGQANSVLSTDIAPLIVEARHQPAVPRSSDPILVTCRVLDESAANVTVRLQWRVDAVTPPPFTTNTMFDDGLHGDGLAGDGVYGATIPAQPNNSVVEFFVWAADGLAHQRTWPAPAIDADDAPVPRASLGQVVNALFQVDNDPQNAFGGVPTMQPVYKLIMTESERAYLAGIPCSGSQNSDAQMNATFISLDAQGTLVRFRCGVRNRGHGSRCASPPNYRLNFSSDQPWKGVVALNLNTRQVHIQHFGSVIANKAGAAGTYSRPVQVRVNNQNLAQSGSPMFGSYAANEAYGADWAERHYPLDSGGNLYRAIRDLPPAPYPEMDYRGDESAPYKRTYVKETNASEDEWQDMIAMLSIMATNGPTLFATPFVGQIVNAEQWLTHLAVMSLFSNGESGLNTGNNDDYYLYRGVHDPRFILVFHDLDQIIGQGGSLGTGESIFRAGNCCAISGDGDRGSFPVMNRFLHWPDFEPRYYQILQHLINTTFSQPQFDALIDQTLGPYVAPNTVSAMKNWMNQRRASVQAQISGLVPPVVPPPVATVSDEPRSPTPVRNATLTVGGEGITHYRYRLNGGVWNGETPVSTPISLSNLPDNSSNIVFVVGRNADNIWQSTNTPTASRPWIVNTAWPSVRLNEVLAKNVAAVNHEGSFPDLIELFNEGPASVDLSGMRLTDDPSTPDKFVFPPGSTLAAGAYWVLYANNPDGTSGSHLGFGLDETGEGVYLFHRVASGGGLLDSVQFGLQVADLSIGRIGPETGTWRLGPPSAGTANATQPLGDFRNLKINEWLAAGQSPLPDDFIELLNLDALPVDLSGLYLTDAPLGAPALHRIPDLSFIAANGFRTLIADGDEGKADHVSFGLGADVGEIALLSPNRTLIDCVAYGPQVPGVSMGRCPDGALAVKPLVLPTPGGGNACPTEPPETQGIPLMGITNVWKYDDSGANLGTSWRTTAYDDAAWPAGPGLLGRLRNGGVLPETILTPLTVNNTRITFYFRTHFNLPANHNLSAIQLRHVVDDGAVFYLNGNELFRYNLPGGQIANTTLASGNILDADYQGPVDVPLNNFQIGDNVLAVEVHQASPNSQDIVFGMSLSGISATNNPSDVGVVINEVFANNATQAEPDGSTPDWVELYNPSAMPADLAGMSLADSTGNRWVFPSPSIIAGADRFRVRFDADLPASTTNTGFGLKSSGDAVTLYAREPDTNMVINTLTFGLQTADFSIGRVPDGGVNWTLTLPTIGSANLAATLGDVMQLRINEWLANPLAGDDDWFEVYNPNPQPVDLSLCYLSDAQTTHRLPALSFIGANTNAWQKFVADNKVAAGADHVPFRLSATSDALGLANANAVPIDSVTFSDQQEDVSEGRLPDGTAAVVRFPGTKSPGEPNFSALTNIVINEVLTHTDLPLEDAIELHNPTASAVDVSGWWLSDSRNSPRRYQIPPNTVVPAGGYHVFYESQFNNLDTAAIPFALSSAEGDQVYLSAANVSGTMNGLRTFVDFGPAENGVSFGRYRTSVGVDFPAMSARTFGVDTPATVEEFRNGTGLSNAYPKVGPVIISEIMYHPPAIVSQGVTNDNVVEEFIELRNISGSPVPLYDPSHPANGWRLRDAVDFRFNATHSIAPGSYLLVVSFDPVTNATALAQFRARYGSNSVLVGPYSGKLDNGGESVELLKPDPPQLNNDVPYVLVEKVVYGDRAPWPTNADGFGLSLQRVSAAGYGNDPTNWVAALPTPGPGGTLDTDGDGMPDDWEMANGFDKNSASDAGEDADNDKLTNLQEYLAGTDPRDATSTLRLASFMNGGMVELRFEAVAGKTYSVLYCDALPGVAGWIKLVDVPAQPANQTIIVPDSFAGQQRFYRIVTPARL